MCEHMCADLLSEICSYLPTDEAAFLEVFPPDDVATHFEAYLTVRRLETTLPREISVPFVSAMSDCIVAGHAHAYLDEPASS